MEKRYLALFDLDGTLVDTDEVNYYAYREALMAFDIKLDWDYFVKKCKGNYYTEFLPEIMGGSEHIEEVHRLKKDAYIANIDRAKKNVHLFEIIQAMRSVYYVAVVTTASKQNTRDILNYFGYWDLFDYIITQEDLCKVKPDPQGFQLAMDHFKVSPEKTVIFEDSDVGIQAARATGATVLVVDKL